MFKNKRWIFWLYISISLITTLIVIFTYNPDNHGLFPLILLGIGCALTFPWFFLGIPGLLIGVIVNSYILWHITSTK